MACTLLRSAPAVLAFVVAAPAFAQNLIYNGGFETGNLDGWTTFVNSEDEADVFASNLTEGAELPISGFPFANGPAGGDWHAQTDLNEASEIGLYQEFHVPAAKSSIIISFDIAVSSFAEFDSETQYVSVDIYESVERIGPCFNLFLGAGTVLGEGDGPNPYAHVEQDITDFVDPGKTYLFSFYELAADNYMFAALDNVRITPAPSPALMALLAAPAFALRRRRA